MSNEELKFMPISLNVSNKKILFVGGGNVAAFKVKLIMRFTSDITVIANEFNEGLLNLPIHLIKKEFEKQDLEGYHVAYICTDNHELNSEVKKLAEEKGVLASICDSPRNCDFVSPAIHKVDNITISVGSNDQNVKQAVRVRNRIKALIEQGILELD